MPTSDELRMLQALPLDLKIRRTEQRIREWVDYWGKDHVCVSFSGGKDSTVLLHIVRKLYGDEIPAVFVNTGLEHIEIQQFVKRFSNVVILRPEINFKEVITRYGYPVISKEVSKCIEATRAYAKKFIEVDRGGDAPECSGQNATVIRNGRILPESRRLKQKIVGGTIVEQSA